VVGVLMQGEGGCGRTRKRGWTLKGVLVGGRDVGCWQKSRAVESDVEFGK